jgi:hypothetical protein
MATGAEHYFTKPINFEEVKKNVLPPDGAHVTEIT